MIFWTKCARKGCFQSKIKKSEYHPRILHIRISLGTKFQLKLTILIFWDQICLKNGEFQSETKKVNITIEFCVFELVEIPNFSLN